MKKFFLFLLFPIIILTGCGEESKIKEQVKKHLIDPDSVTWGRIELKESELGKIGCVELNSKNRVGGYTGVQALIVANLNDNGWKVVSDEGVPFNICMKIVAEKIDKY